MHRINVFILFVLSLFVFTKVQAQQLDGFKYVWVETLRYADDSIDKYGISQNVRNSFLKIGLKDLPSGEYERVMKRVLPPSLIKYRGGGEK